MVRRSMNPEMRPIRDRKTFLTPLNKADLLTKRYMPSINVMLFVKSQQLTN